VVADAALAGALLVACVGGTNHLAPDRPWAMVLAVIAPVSLVLRRFFPLITLAIVVVTTSTYLVYGYPYGPILLTVVVAAYTVGRYLPARRAAVASAVGVLFLLAHAVGGARQNVNWLGILGGAAWFMVAFGAGVALRAHRDSVVRNRAEFARQHADEERLRVARDVHDIVGHGLSAIQMQAEIALHVMGRRPGQAADLAATSLAAISRTSQEALDELRVTLAVVRGENDRDPLPGLARLPALAARTSQSGAPVKVETSGEPRPLPGPVDLAAYRVVQESLTNVLRHAGPASVTVRVGYSDDEVSVDVQDTGRGGMTPGGRGIVGMRQRVTALGGTFAAGPVDQGGFRVTARLPTP
jgi:signal transduction histidine kinase